MTESSPVARMSETHNVPLPFGPQSPAHGQHPLNLLCDLGPGGSITPVPFLPVSSALRPVWPVLPPLFPWGALTAELLGQKLPLPPGGLPDFSTLQESTKDTQCPPHTLGIHSGRLQPCAQESWSLGAAPTVHMNASALLPAEGEFVFWGLWGRILFR